ncbi:hypothetical protein GCM10009547_11130 [Sporichthya brevicatena]|uniref:Uncharacterized protein n=1 Tax=Sporichthya brevicatena TaxID=171442 RepID=A0ABP3RJS2_9ACTN
MRPAPIRRGQHARLGKITGVSDSDSFLPSSRREYVPPPVRGGLPPEEWISFADAAQKLGIRPWRVRVRALDTVGHLDGAWVAGTGEAGVARASLDRELVWLTTASRRRRLGRWLADFVLRVLP